MKKIFISLGLLALLGGCSDFLEEDSRSQMTEDYYLTEQGLYEGVTAIYANTRLLYQWNMFRVNFYSDIAENASSQNNSYAESSDVSYGPLNELFRDLHKGIMIMNRLEQFIGDQPTDRKKEIYLAEIRGMRAHYYQIQVELWGKYGHYQKKVYTAFESSMLEINQKSVEFFYQQIFRDINYAIEKLPVKGEVTEFGRLTQGAAKAFKSRFLLAVAGYAHQDYASEPEFNLHGKLGYSSLNQVYEEAKTLAQDVISKHGYTLEPEYARVFDAFNKLSNEVIWSVQWTSEKMFNTTPQYFHRVGVGRTSETLKMQAAAGGGVTASTKSLVVSRMNDAGALFNYVMPAHSMYYGREYRHVMPNFHWITMYSDLDKRKLANFETVYLRIDDDKAAPKNMGDTVCYMPLRAITPAEDKQHDDWVASKDPKAYYLDGMNEVFDMTDPASEHYGGPLKHRSRYYSLKKFFDRSRTEMGKQEAGNANAIVLRLAEMHLIVAECNWKLGLGDQAVYEALEPVWARSFSKLADADVYKKKGVNLDFILDEYEREVGMEFNSFFLLKRTRALVDRIRKNNPKSAEEAKDNILRWRDYVKKEHFIKPLPLNQVNAFRNITAEMLPPGYDYGANL
ncbi:RagB/SusD family nutrient uptake outer membrane protein [Ravibacter arvi]|uniref:RagB/SusD family nutrient uptake outer membrane protein n=1 Tax=Ravibacter arvi TaxID=2051041 RepID=A0ABP8LUP6_9BACT